MLKSAAKYLAWVLAVLVCAVVAIVGAAYITNPVFYGRLLTVAFIDDIKDVEWYRPVETVRGGSYRPLPRATTGQRGISPEAWSAALAYAKATETFALLAWHNGQVEYEYYADGFSPADLTSTASMHKSVLALVVGQAISQGIIRSIDESVADYIPEWRDDARKAITLRHLLTMSSGLARQPITPSPFGEFMQLTMGTNIEQLALTVPAGDPPGTEFSYYNVNPQILATVIERATKMRYAEFLSDSLWSKIGAAHAKVYLDREKGSARTYCCLLASAEDWLRIGLLLLNRGMVDGQQVVSREWVAQTVSPSLANPNYGFLTWLGTTYEPKRSYGKGVAVTVPHSAEFATPDVIYFDGAGGQRVYIVPSRNLVIVRIGKGGIDFKTNEFKWDDALIPNSLIKGIKEKGQQP
jgi:CubicO group peptidase (beta-lactamase class C family)